LVREPGSSDVAVTGGGSTMGALHTQPPCGRRQICQIFPTSATTVHKYVTAAPTKVASAAATKVSSDPARKVAPGAAWFLNLNFW
jgi:hypothetical protein